MSFDKYGDGQDPYCYPGTSVLKNRFDLRNDEDLREVELYISATVSEQLEFQDPPERIMMGEVLFRTTLNMDTMAKCPAQAPDTFSCKDEVSDYSGRYLQAPSFTTTSTRARSSKPS